MKSYRCLYIVLISLLTGCGYSVIPGMHMSGAPDPEPPNIPGVKFIPISAGTVHEQNLNASSVAAEQSKSWEQANTTGYQYRIGPRDVLAVTVWEHPELTIPAGEFRSPEATGHVVAEDGTMFFPYAGMVQVAGKTTAEIRELLTKGIESVIENPQMDVKVVSFRSQKAYVAGEVSKPGPQPLTDVPLTVADAIGLAGDLTENADLSGAILTHNGKARKIDLLAMYDKGDTRANVLLQNGDILNIPDRNTQKVFVMGEVVKPASIVTNKRGISLTEAIGDVGGVAPLTSDPAQIYVIRSNGDESEIYYLNAKSPDALILGDQFRLKPRDVVYVETAALARWDRLMQQLVTTSTIVRNFGRIVGSQ